MFKNNYLSLYIYNMEIYKYLSIYLEKSIFFFFHLYEKIFFKNTYMLNFLTSLKSCKYLYCTFIFKYIHYKIHL